MDEDYRSQNYFPAGFMPFFSYYDAPTQRVFRSPNLDSQDHSDRKKIKPRQAQNTIQLNCEKNEKEVSDSKWPLIDITEYSTKYIVEAEVPGFQKKDISIDFENSTGILTLQGTWSEPTIKNNDLVIMEDEDKSDYEPISGNSTIHSTFRREILEGEAKRILSERRSARDFKRSFKIKERVDPEKISASLNDGIIVITIPKVKDERKHRIADNSLKIIYRTL